MAFLIVGLGNPGKEYEKTRHNVGFMALDEFQQKHDFPPFKLSKKYSSLVSEGILGSAKVVLAKPQTLMNNSGKAVKSLSVKCLVKFWTCGTHIINGQGSPLIAYLATDDLVVVHDDIDIPLGKIKISKGSGSAGHKGVESIIQSLGTKDFTRIRIGIQPAKGKPNDVESFVLKSFAPKEIAVLKQTIVEVSTILNTTILRSIAVS